MVTEVNCVMLGVDNPFWSSQCQTIVSSAFDFIDTKRCHENKLNKFYEDMPHITLMYGLENKIGPNSMYCFLKITNRDLYKELKANSVITIDKPIIDYFSSPEGYVLKLNLENIPQLDLLTAYRNCLIDKFGMSSEFKEYHPHMTISYISSKVDETKLADIINNINTDKFTNFDINSFIISGEDLDNQVIYF